MTYVNNVVIYPYEHDCRARSFATPDQEITMPQTAVKTFSADQSFHEMLVRAQALSPVLTYIMCWFLLRPHDKQENPLVVRSILAPHNQPFFYSRFEGKYNSSMCGFLRHIFQGYVVHVGSEDYHFNEFYFLYADVAFVHWLQSGVVTMDDKRQLLTINQ